MHIIAVTKQLTLLIMKRIFGWLIELVTDCRDLFDFDWNGKTYKVIIIKDQMPERWYALKCGDKVFAYNRDFRFIKYAIENGSCKR